MIEHRFHVKLREQLEEAIEVEIASLLEGSAEDFADYRYRAGRLWGLRQALEISAEVQSKLLGEHS